MIFIKFNKFFHDPKICKMYWHVLPFGWTYSKVVRLAKVKSSFRVITSNPKSYVVPVPVTFAHNWKTTPASDFSSMAVDISRTSQALQRKKSQNQVDATGSHGSQTPLRYSFTCWKINKLIITAWCCCGSISTPIFG